MPTLLRSVATVSRAHHHTKSARRVWEWKAAPLNQSSWMADEDYMPKRPSTLVGQCMPDAIKPNVSTRPFRRGNIPTDTPYARRMTVLSNQIFGHTNIVVDDESAELVAKMAERPVSTNPRINPDTWYPPHAMFHWLFKLLRAHGVYRDEHRDWNDEMQRARDKRGKPLIGIGQGKRMNK